MERLADLRSSDVSPGSGQTSQYKGIVGTNVETNRLFSSLSSAVDDSI